MTSNDLGNQPMNSVSVSLTPTEAAFAMRRVGRTAEAFTYFKTSSGMART